MLEREETKETIGLNRSRRRSARPAWGEHSAVKISLRDLVCLFGGAGSQGHSTLTAPHLDSTKPNRSWEPGRVMGESSAIHGRLLGAPPATAGPRNISHAYGQRAEGSFRVFGPFWKVGERRWALSGRQRTARPDLFERFPRA